MTQQFKHVGLATYHFNHIALVNKPSEPTDQAVLLGLAHKVFVLFGGVLVSWVPWDCQLQITIHYLIAPSTVVGFEHVVAGIVVFRA